MSAEKRAEVRAFVKKWTSPDIGDEKSQTQKFWIDLLQSLFDKKNAVELIQFEKPVELSHTSYIDAYIPQTKVLIEQKSIQINLDKAAHQSDGSMMTPFDQAKRYHDWLPIDEKGRWIVVCNFDEIRIHDLKTPKAPPQIVFVKDLVKESYRLNFLLNENADVANKEVELSMAAGEIVGQLYDALYEQYGEKRDEPEYLKSLNELCVRLVFCLYAEDAGLFGKPKQFHDYLKSFPESKIRERGFPKIRYGALLNHSSGERIFSTTHLTV